MAPVLDHVFVGGDYAARIDDEPRTDEEFQSLRSGSLGSAAFGRQDLGNPDVDHGRKCTGNHVRSVAGRRRRCHGRYCRDRNRDRNQQCRNNTRE
ncbi:MAG TPA: hypothetical protein VMU81_07050 [Acetobacteraceae bacterium]|nr:hypothetical protein [Acetobacteraceae bacterium]